MVPPKCALKMSLKKLSSSDDLSSSASALLAAPPQQPAKFTQKQVHCSATPSFAYMLTRFHKDEVEENGGTLEVLNVRHSRCFAPSAGVSLMMYHVRLHGRPAHIVFPHRGSDLCKVTVSQHFRLV